MNDDGKDTKAVAPLEMGNVTPLRKPVECPNCTNISSRETYPFCCKRCADADMGRWFNGTYAIDIEADG